jgi:hypothetical protein
MKSARDQGDKNLDFDGMAGNGVNRGSNRFAGNQHSGIQNPNALINKGVGPRKGNFDSAPTKVGPSATKDAFRPAPHTSEASGREYPRNIDSMSYGKQERTPGGTRPWEPSATQNYKGDIDRINIQAKGSNGMGQSQSTNPIAIAKRGGDPDSFNYGPKKQY